MPAASCSGESRELRIRGFEAQSCAFTRAVQSCGAEVGAIVHVDGRKGLADRCVAVGSREDRDVGRSESECWSRS